MKYEKGERDLIMLQHKFVVEWKDGKEVCFRFSLFAKSSCDSVIDWIIDRKR
jgi:spermidine synthase / saccharopine dehydrogenase (NADP+, L-glutamate-forming)